MAAWPYFTMNLASRLDLLVSRGGFDERWLRFADVATPAKAGAARPAVQPGTQLSRPRMPPWQTAPFWSLFNAAKKAGKYEGRRRPPVVIE